MRREQPLSAESQIHGWKSLFIHKKQKKLSGTANTIASARENLVQWEEKTSCRGDFFHTRDREEWEAE